MIKVLFAHAGGIHAETEAASGLLDTVAHQPVWSALLISFFVLLGYYAILAMFHVRFITRLLALLPMVIALSILFFQHNPGVATILLSGGFILTFVLVFTMLRGSKPG